MNYENTRRHKILGVLLEHSEICAACATYLNGDIESDTAPCNFGRMIFKIGNFIFCYTDDNGNFDFPSPSPKPSPRIFSIKEDA